MAGISDAPQAPADFEVLPAPTQWTMDAPTASADWIGADRIPAVPSGTVANFTAAGSLTATAVAVPGVLALFGGVGELTASVSVIVAVGAPFGTTAVASATAGVGAPFSATGVLSAIAVAGATVSAPFSGTGTLAATSTVGAFATAPFSGTGTFGVTQATYSVGAGYTGAGVLGATVQIAVGANFTGTGALAATAEAAVGAPFAGTGTLSALDDVYQPTVLLGEWEFPSSTLVDSSGNAHTGTLGRVTGSIVTPPSYVTGPATNTTAISWGEADQYVDVGETGLEPQYGGYCAMAWIKAPSYSTSEYCGIFGRTRGSNSTRAGLQIDTSGALFYMLRWKSRLLYGSVGAISDGSWHHVAVIDNDNRGAVFIDGTKVFENTSPATGSVTWESGYDWVIGAISGLCTSVVGQEITAARLFAGTLADADITYWMNAGPTQLANFTGSGSLATSSQVAVSAPFGGVGSLSAAAVPGATVAAQFTGSGTLAATTKLQFSDSFTRANGALGSNWTGVNIAGTAGVVPVIASDAFAPGTATSDTQQVGIYSVQALSGADMRVRATISGTISSTLLSGVILRATSGFSASGTGVVALLSSSTTYIYAALSSSWSSEASVSYSSWVAGDVIEFRAVGTLYSVIRNPDTSPVTVLTWTDSGGAVTVTSSMRYAGLYVRSNSGGASSNTWKNFVARDN